MRSGGYRCVPAHNRWDALKPLVALSLDRARNADAFAQMGLKSSPAVAVVDADWNVLERFEGAVKAPLLAKALAKAAGPAKS